MHSAEYPSQPAALCLLGCGAEHGDEDGFLLSQIMRSSSNCAGWAAGETRSQPEEDRHTRGDPSKTHKGAVEKQAARRSLTQIPEMDTIHTNSCTSSCPPVLWEEVQDSASLTTFRDPY